MLTFFGPLPTMSAAKVNRLFGELEAGFKTLPINRRGYRYYEALQARNKLLKEVHDIVNTGQTEQHNDRPKDILDTLIDQDNPLPQSVIGDNAVGFLFAADRTTTGLISFTVKYLHDNPDVLQKLKEEQQKIRNGKASGESLSWEDLKEMRFTYQEKKFSLAKIKSKELELAEVRSALILVEVTHGVEVESIASDSVSLGAPGFPEVDTFAEKGVASQVSAARRESSDDYFVNALSAIDIRSAEMLSSDRSSPVENDSTLAASQIEGGDEGVSMENAGSDYFGHPWTELI